LHQHVCNSYEILHGLHGVVLHPKWERGGRRRESFAFIFLKHLLSHKISGACIMWHSHLGNFHGCYIHITDDREIKNTIVAIFSYQIAKNPSTGKKVIRGHRQMDNDDT
jgi:hypothetical protein